MGAGCKRIPEKDEQVNIIMLNLGTQLLLPAEMSGRNLWMLRFVTLSTSFPVVLRSIQVMFAQYAAVSNAEILHQFFLRIVCDQSDIHNRSSPY